MINYTSYHQVFIKIYIKNFIFIHTIPNIFNEVDIDIVIEEIFNNKHFEKCKTEMETCESIEE